MTKVKKRQSSLGDRVVSPGPGKHEVAEPMQRIVLVSQALMANYLATLHLIEAPEAAIRERARDTGTAYLDDDPALGAIAGAGFRLPCGCTEGMACRCRNTDLRGDCRQAMSIVGPTS
jgi:Tfp pilus assembly protein PilX